MAKKNPHIGSSFESWLDQEGIREEVTSAAIKATRALANDKRAAIADSQRKLPDFRIVVYRGIECISELTIPANRISTQDLDSLLRVLYARYAKIDDDELASFFVNARKGTPMRHSLHECKMTIDWEKRTMNRSCGDYRCMVIAITPVSDDVLDAIRNIQRQNRGE